MPYPPRVKFLAYELDRACWRSYSGKPKEFKREMDARRTAALKRAETINARPYPFAQTSRLTVGAATRAAIRAVVERHGVGRAREILRTIAPGATKITDIPDEKWPEMHQKFLDALKPKPEIFDMGTLKLIMMLHFATFAGPLTPEERRTSAAYTKYVKELLAEGMIERPTEAQRKEHPGWAYKATAKGRVYVEALKAVPYPVPAAPQWVMPPK